MLDHRVNVPQKKRPGPFSSTSRIIYIDFARHTLMTKLAIAWLIPVCTERSDWEQDEAAIRSNSQRLVKQCAKEKAGWR